MTLWTLLGLAVVQGLTEFLPVSSSGHLALARLHLGVPRTGLLVELALHLGTLAAVLLAYRRDWAALAGSLFGRARANPALPPLRRLLGWIVLATLPAVFAGLLLEDRVAALFDSPRGIGTGLLVTAFALALASRRLPAARRPLRSLTVADALAVGLAQALALAPGVSRSGLTVAAGLWRRLDPAEAARFAFLLAVPVVAGAGFLGIVESASGTVVSEARGGDLFLAALLAGLVGYASIHLFLGALRRARLLPFVVYCGALGLLALLGPSLRETP